MSNPENPFFEWNVVYITYCTGDTHWGNNVHTYPPKDLIKEGEIQHKGFVNAMSAVNWTFENFEDPSQVFLAGDSAGGYGSILFAPYLMERYENSSFVHFSDSAAGIGTEDFVEKIITNWGVAQNIHPFLENVKQLAENSPRTLTTSYCYESVAKMYPQHRFVQFNTVQDKTQKYFYATIGGNADEWRDRMEENVSAWEESLPNFSSYTAWGEQHVVTLSNQFYTYQVNGRRLRDFVNDLILGNDVESVHCSNCDDPELYEVTNPVAVEGEEVVQPYQDPEFKSITQGSAQCGPTSLAIVLGYYSRGDVYTDSDGEIIVDMKADFDNLDAQGVGAKLTGDTNFCKWVNGGNTTGTSWSQMKYATIDLEIDGERQFAVELHDIKTELELPEGIQERKERLEDIYQRYLLHKRPVIIHLSRSAWRSGHYMVLIGYDKEKQVVYYADPNDGKIHVESLDRFIEAKFYRSVKDPEDDNLAYWDGGWMGVHPAEPGLASVYDSPWDFIFDRNKIKKGLIINGDDFGLNDNVNQGIIDAYENGMLTSTSVQAPTQLSGAAFAYASANYDLGTGIHLTLTRPGFSKFGPLTGESQSPALVEKDVFFPTSIVPLLFNAWKPDVRKQIVAELSAQIASAEDYGIDITHIDCHAAWCHVYNDNLDEIYMELATQNGVPVRWRYPDGQKLEEHGVVSVDMLIMPDMNQKDTEDDYEKRKKSIMSKLRNLKRAQIAELVLHPQSGEVYENQDFRVLDYNLAFDPDVRQFLEDQDISLVSYRVLKDIYARMQQQNQNQ